MIVIIDYGVGNLHSVYNAFKKLGFLVKISSDKTEILNASKVVLPGVGAFKNAIDTIKNKGFDTIIKQVINKGTPILGICVGLQLLFERSYEYGVHEGLGILKGEIVPFKEIYHINKLLKIPHVGWNDLEIENDSKLLKKLDNNYVYFVHSFYLETNENFVSSYTNYGKKIAVSIEYKNIFATQFHPEKSGDVGLQILRNFGEL